MGGEKGEGHEEEISSEVLSPLTVLLLWPGKVSLVYSFQFYGEDTATKRAKETCFCK